MICIHTWKNGKELIMNRDVSILMYSTVSYELLGEGKGERHGRSKRLLYEIYSSLERRFKVQIYLLFYQISFLVRENRMILGLGEYLVEIQGA
jgi:hypothetical protein